MLKVAFRTLCSEKKHPLLFFCYISVENAYICTKFSWNICEETSISKVEKLNILCYRWHHADVIFRCL